jgi:uncharacterized protein (DUF302 family)/uncharacterized membrane protein YidH (DUF202 family)
MTEQITIGSADYLAAERTFLAWIRTGIALMGFGFVVARFGLFLQALEAGEAHLPMRSSGLSSWLGVALVLLGIFVNVRSAWSHLRLVRSWKRRENEFAQPSYLAIIVAAVLAVLGLVLAIYLVAIRGPRQPSIGSVQEESMTLHSENGIVTIPSHQSVDQTIQKLDGILRTKGVKVFTLIDHSGEAEKAGMPMRPTKLLIFGNPKAGTPLMIASPSIAIDLPLKLLVWEDDAGKVWISYNSPSYLQKRHGLPPELLQNISVVETLASTAAE